MPFPLDPVNGQQATLNGVAYTYSSTLTAWTVTSSGGTLTSANTMSATGNITGGNILTAGTVSATGNITGNYFIGNGSQLTSINVANVVVTANSVNYNEGGANAVTRTVTSKLQESISVKDFGAVGDGVTDDSTAFNQCVAELVTLGGGTMIIPAGEYLLNSTVTINNGGIWIKGNGSGDGGTWIINGQTNAPAIQFGTGSTLYRGGISSCVFGQKSGVTAVAGNSGLFVQGFSNININDIQVFPFPNALYNGIVLNNVSQSYASALGIQGCVNAGIYFLNNVLDVFLDQSRSDANGAYGLLIEDSQGIYVTNFSAYTNSVNAILLQKGSSGTYFNINLFFVNCIADTSGTDDWVITQAHNFFMTNCWGSAQTNTAINPNATGILLSGANVTDGTLVNCASLACNGHGLAIIECNRINVIGGQFGSGAQPGQGNGKGIGTTGGSGIFVGGSAANVQITNVMSVFNAQYGIAINSSPPPTNLNISGGYLSNNTSGTIFPITAANSVRTVSGVNPVYSVTTPAIPASNTPVTNNTGVDVTVYISGGTVTAVSVSGVSITTGTPISVLLPSRGNIAITYSVVPTAWRWIGN